MSMLILKAANRHTQVVSKIQVLRGRRTMMNYSGLMKAGPTSGYTVLLRPRLASNNFLISAEAGAFELRFQL